MTNRKRQQSKRQRHCHSIEESMTKSFDLRNGVLKIAIHKARDGRARISLEEKPYPKGIYPPELREMANDVWFYDVAQDLARKMGYEV
jgi:hypothetical protein